MPISRKDGQDNMFRGIKKKLRGRLRDSPTTSVEVQDKLDAKRMRARMKRGTRRKQHNDTPKRFAYKSRNTDRNDEKSTV